VILGETQYVAYAYSTCIRMTQQQAREPGHFNVTTLWWCKYTRSRGASFERARLHYRLPSYMIVQPQPPSCCSRRLRSSRCCLSCHSCSRLACSRRCVSSSLLEPLPFANTSLLMLSLPFLLLTLPRCNVCIMIVDRSRATQLRLSQELTLLFNINCPQNGVVDMDNLRNRFIVMDCPVGTVHMWVDGFSGEDTHAPPTYMGATATLYLR
jgi:hypothetical protein